MRYLIVVDMQKDFVDGALGTKEAVAIVDNVVNKINGHDGDIFVTYDTHFENYMETSEGKKLPVPHCIKGTDGWKLNDKVQAALDAKAYTEVEKITFGSVDLPQLVKKAVGDGEFEIELVGLCTDICVVSNALLTQAALPEINVKVVADACVGVTPDTHSAALTTMKMCQIDII